MKLADFFRRLRGRFQYFFSLPGFRKRPALTIWRALAWRARCWLGVPAVVRVPGGAKLVLPPKWHGEGATLFYIVREYYEPEFRFLRRFLNPGETFVDAGANCGVYTFAAAGIAGEKGLVLAFEPGHELYAGLQRGVKLNGFKHVRLFEAGLSDTTGSAKLYAHPHGASSFSLGRSGGNADGAFFEIQVRKLDDVLDAEGVARVDCIKMDVEGAEELILRGAPRLFERCKPRVIFEINATAIAALNLQTAGAWDFLKARGYEFFSLDEEGGVSPLAVPPGGGNVIALHPGKP
ncbi:MAG TPA: FkbM family methyltransferase [Chthoniobacteraceae bacterium]|nr:FkbM family methyltransferase [Chthoniobacteraceae bacterium]